MAIPPGVNYKLEHTRYRHYFHNLWTLYQQPAVKVSSALLLTLFTIIFFAAFAIRPTLVTVAELVKKIEDQQNVLNQMKQKSATLASAQQEYIAAQDKIPLLNTAVPPDEQLTQLIKMIEGTAAFHQIALDSLSLGDITYAGPAAPRTSGVQERAISLSVSGTYDTIKSFIFDLNRIPRLLSIETVSFGTDASTAQATDTNSLRLTVNLSVHYLPRDDTVTP